MDIDTSNVLSPTKELSTGSPLLVESYQESPRKLKRSFEEKLDSVKVISAMNSKDEQADSDVSRFTLDGVVAEMVIEVEENEQNSTKASRLQKVDKKQKSPGLQKISSPANEDSENESSASKDDDLSEKGTFEIEEVKPVEGLEEKSSNINTDGLENKETLMESEDGLENKETLMESEDGLENKETLIESEDSLENQDDEVGEKNKNVEDLKDTQKKQAVESIKTEKGSESSNETPGGQKKLRGRPKKKMVSKSEELKNETRQSKDDSNEKSDDGAESSQLKTRTSALKSKSGQPSTTTSLKRSNKATISSEEEKYKVPEKKLRSSSEDNTPKRSKRSVSFSPVATEVDSTKRQSLRKTTLLKATETPSKSTPSTSKSTPSTSKSSPSTSKSTPSISKATPSTSKSTPASNKTTQASSKATPVSNKTTPASGKGSVVKPASSVDSKQKAWDLDPEGINNLESFPKIKKQVKQAEVKFLKSLHHTLYNKILSKDVQGKELRKEILKFQGYSFKKSSDAYKKHKSILEKMPKSTISEIAKILDIKEDIYKIMTFLLKPSKVIYCEVDPFHPSMQPVLSLQKITLENSSAKTSSDDSSNNEPFSSEDTLATSKRKRFPSTKLRFYESDFDVPASKKRSQETERSRVASSTPTVVKKEFPSTVAKKAETSIKAQTVKQASPRRAKHKVRIGARRKTKRVFGPTPLPGGKMGIVKKPISSDLLVRRRALELAIEIQETVNPTELEEFSELEEIADLNEDDESALASFEYEADIKQEVVTEDESEDHEKSIAVTRDIPDDIASQEPEIIKSFENTSSDVTLSADEAKETTQDEAPQKKRFYKPTVIPLKTYPIIKGNILRADYSALQRLHIVLFGASDKASNLRGNILSFGGFPFYEGSEEWKQKEFLLSLLSQSTLKEYLDILGMKYPDGNQRLLIKKLMKFLAAPIEKLPDDDIEEDDDAEMEVVALEEMVPIKTPPEPKKAPIKVQKKKPIKKPVGDKKPPRFRKVLMDEAQVRRLEADLAREQRILEREKKLHEEQAKKLRLSVLNKPKPVPGQKQPLTANQTDTELLNALLETVYQRRELKKAGAKVSIPNKGGHTRLGELANVKFLVVTANYNDLDVLHHLIYMTEANKSRVRKNILDFAGFNFTEESPAYQDRMNFLTSLGYDISRRIAFLLGLCPYKTLIAQQDLNELIMYFLMSPCQSKQVPIKHLPTTFFGNEMPVELSALVQRHSGELTVSAVDESAARLSSNTRNSLQITVSENQPSPKARKSFKSSFTSSKMRGLTPSISTLPLKAPEKLLKPTFVSQKPMQSFNKPTAAMFSQQAMKAPISQSAPSQEFYIQQQTADGQQKTFKLVKLPPNHPLSTAFKNQIPQPLTSTTTTPQIQPQPITINAPVIGAPGLPPGLIVFKNNPTNPALSSIMQTVPLSIGQTTEKMINPLLIPNISGVNPVLLPKLGENHPKILPKPAEVVEEVLPDEKELAVPVECNYSTDEETEELCPLEDGDPPTDEEIYGCIQDIIHGCPSLEDITLRNVISRVSAKYPNFDLTPQHYFMKECVKKIIMGS